MSKILAKTFWAYVTIGWQENEDYFWFLGHEARRTASRIVARRSWTLKKPSIE